MTAGYGCAGLTAVIAGGTSGIGLATAAKLLADGAEVWLLGRSAARAQRAVAALWQETGRRAVYLPCDVSVRQACGSALRTSGITKIDILVNSAGMYREQRLEQATEEELDALLDANLKGTLWLTQAALPYMRGSGSIVNLASDAGISGNYGCPLYCAAKGAVVALTRALALDLAPGVRVNCVCPADVETPLLEAQLRDGCCTREEMAAVYPLGRLGSAAEIAHVICSVASPLNGFMTGSIITVDGGLTAK